MQIDVHSVVHRQKNTAKVVFFFTIVKEILINSNTPTFPTKAGRKSLY